VHCEYIFILDCEEYIRVLEHQIKISFHFDLPLGLEKAMLQAFEWIFSDLLVTRRKSSQLLMWLLQTLFHCHDSHSTIIRLIEKLNFPLCFARHAMNIWMVNEKGSVDTFRITREMSGKFISNFPLDSLKSGML